MPLKYNMCISFYQIVRGLSLKGVVHKNKNSPVMGYHKENGKSFAFCETASFSLISFSLNGTSNISQRRKPFMPAKERAMMRF